jgi:hypothetical protein
MDWSIHNVMFPVGVIRQRGAPRMCTLIVAGARERRHVADARARGRAVARRVRVAPPASRTSGLLRVTSSDLS